MGKDTQKQRILTDAVIYIGQNNTFGIAKEVTVPNVTPAYAERNNLATVGTQYLPNCKVSVDDVKILLDSFYPSVFASIANPLGAVNLKITANSMKFANGEVASHESVELYIRGRSKEFGLLGEMKGHDDSDYPMNFHLAKVRLICGGKELYHVDFDNNVYIVNGVDIRAVINKNLGLT